MSNSLIARVKQYRARHGCTLKEAHDAVMVGRDMEDFSQPLHPPAMPDELSRLRAENERLREALRDLLSWFPDRPTPPQWVLKAGEYRADDAVDAARKALEGGE